MSWVMNHLISLESLLRGCADDAFDDGIRIDTKLVPLAGPGGPVKPAVYEGGVYQEDKRWATPDDSEATPVIVVDNTPSQANRLEDALRRHAQSIGIPELVLDLSDMTHLPAHLPRRLSSLQFPHRNADAYLRDSMLGDTDFIKTSMGQDIFGATAATCGPLVAWFPQALLYGFWQSHLGKKRHNSKHARAWVSEIVGWHPATIDTHMFGLKGDALNLNIDEGVSVNLVDQMKWNTGSAGKVKGGKSKKLSDIGHGQIPFMTKNTAAAAAVSFARVTQRATVSFAQLRRVSLGTNNPEADAAVRALLVALGLHAHQLAFGRGFALRSGAELRPEETAATWLSSNADENIDLGGANHTLSLLQSAKEHAKRHSVPLDGWDRSPTTLTPRGNLRKAILKTWPEFPGSAD